MNSLAERVVRALLRDASSTYLVLDSNGWLQDPELQRAGHELGIRFEPVGTTTGPEIARIQDLASNLNNREGEQLAIIVSDEETLTDWHVILGNKWKRTDVQPATILTALDPELTTHLDAASVSQLLPSYGNETRPVRGGRATALILLEELHGINTTRLRTLDGCLEEAYRIHAIGGRVHPSWIERIKGDLPPWDLSISLAECLVDATKFADALQAAIEKGLLPRQPWQRRVELITSERPRTVARDAAAWHPRLDLALTIQEIEAVNWQELELAQWASKGELLGRFGMAEALGLLDEPADTRAELDQAFCVAIERHYQALPTVPWHSKPVMVHHILPHLAARYSDRRIALVVVDCLSLPAWQVVRQALARAEIIPDSESTSFACIPTITRVSRQALLSGKLPREFGDTISGTQAEQAGWREFWRQAGAREHQIRHVGAADSDIERVREAAEDADARRLAITLNGEDDLIHSTVRAATLEWRDIHASLARTWIPQTLIPILQVLLSNGWVVFLASDHGAHHVEKEIRVRREGVKTDSRGQRVRVYPNTAFREESGADGVEWTLEGMLPDGFHALLAPPRHGYGIGHGWTHGGAAWDEVLVPFVRFGGEPRSSVSESTTR